MLLGCQLIFILEQKLAKEKFAAQKAAVGKEAAPSAVIIVAGICLHVL